MMVDPETATERRRRARRARRAPALPAPQPALPPDASDLAVQTQALLTRHRTDDPLALAALLLAEWRDRHDLAAIAARHALTERAVRSAIDSELARRGLPILATIEQEAAASRARWEAARRRARSSGAPAARGEGGAKEPTRGGGGCHEGSGRRVSRVSGEAEIP